MIKKIYSRYTEATKEYEDAPVLDFLSSLGKKPKGYLEVASGVSLYFYSRIPLDA